MQPTGSMTRDDLLALGQTGPTPAFVNSAQSALNAHPDDADLRLQLIQHLVQAGLFYRAARLARGFDASILQRADFAQLVQQLETPRENGLVSWETFASQFERNLRCCEQRHEWVEAVIRAWKPEHLELHRSRDGRWQAFEPFDAVGRGRWRPAFGMPPPSDRLDDLKRQAAGQVVSPIVIDGVGFGESALLFHAATVDTLNGASPYVYVVEQSPVAFAVALHLQDWSALMNDERVVFCVGYDAYDQLAAAIDSRSHAPAPQIIVTSPGWGGEKSGRAGAIVKVAIERNVSAALSLRAEAKALYSERSGHYWSRRFRAALDGSGPPLRILAMTSLYTTVLQFATRDTVKALDQLGFQTRLLIEENKHGYISPAEAMRTIRDFEPDLIFMIDHTRKSQKNLVIEEVPILSWIQDRLTWLFDAATGSEMTALDFCMGIGRDELTTRFNYPRDRFFGCDMATNEGALCDGGLSRDKDGSKYDCDIAFASHASEPPEVFLRESIARLRDAGFPDLMEAIYWELKSRTDRCELNGALDFEYFLDSMALALGVSLQPDARGSLMSFFLRPLADRFLRHQTIGWAANWVEATGRRMNLYGGGWESHPQYGRYARGNLPHGRELGRAFRGAKINLHTGLNWAFHQRVLDGLTAGGFFLVRRHGADISHEVSRAIYEVAASGRQNLPLSVRPSDLPQPLADEFRRLRRWKGRDAESGVELNARKLEIMRRRFEACSDPTPGMLWPSLRRLTFETESEFVALADHYVSDADARGRIAGPMREAVLSRFGYQTLLRRAIGWLSDSLAAGATSPAARAGIIERPVLTGA